MRRAVLLAHPAGHSLSPVLHDAAFAACGIPARYQAWDVPPAELGAAVRRVREDAAILGANVTIPHKRAVRAHLDGVAEAAAAIGAVNTIRRDGDRLLGDNTDGVGFLRSLAESGFDPAGRVVLLLGAGGAARAVGWALSSAGAAEVRVVNRTADTAHALVDALARVAGRTKVAAAGTASEAAGPEVDLFVNATSVGMLRGGSAPDVSPAPPGVFRAGAAERSDAEPRLAVDLVYRPRRTRFLRDAAAAGLRTVDGVGMLLHQGAAAFEIWTGRPAPVAAMRAAVEDALLGEGPS